jgi:uncharacterized membrane protein YkgB
VLSVRAAGNFLSVVDKTTDVCVISASAGGFPAMAGNVAFLMKDVVLLAVSVYLLKQDIVRLSLPARQPVASGVA